MLYWTWFGLYKRFIRVYVKGMYVIKRGPRSLDQHKKWIQNNTYATLPQDFDTHKYMQQCINLNRDYKLGTQLYSIEHLGHCPVNAASNIWFTILLDRASPSCSLNNSY